MNVSFTGRMRGRSVHIGVRPSGDPADGVITGPDAGKAPADLPGTTGLPLSGTGKVALGTAAVLVTLGAVYLATS